MMQTSITPTVEEYESQHGGMPAVRGEMSWTTLDLQPAAYAPGEGSFQQHGVDMPDIPYAYDNLDYVSHTNMCTSSLQDNPYDPFQSTIAISNGAAQEPLRRDRHDATQEILLNRRTHLVSHIYADPDTGFQDYDEAVGYAAHEDSLAYRSHAADVINQEIEPHFTARSDRREMMLQAEERLKRSSNSVLGRSSYGNYGV